MLHYCQIVLLFVMCVFVVQLLCFFPTAPKSHLDEEKKCPATAYAVGLLSSHILSPLHVVPGVTKAVVMERSWISDRECFAALLHEEESMDPLEEV